MENVDGNIYLFQESLPDGRGWRPADGSLGPALYTHYLSVRSIPTRCHSPHLLPDVSAPVHHGGHHLAAVRELAGLVIDLNITQIMQTYFEGII